MSDDLDIASERAQLALDAAMTVRKPEGPAATGRCLYCGAPNHAMLRWCDADCRDEWELERERGIR